MKKIFLSSLVLLCMVTMFTACESDRDSNPTLVQPTTGFTLFEPANKNVDLFESTSIHFTWTHPDYGGWPVAVDYQMQVSPTNDWSTSVAQAMADETGATKATYDPVRVIMASHEGDLPTTELAKSLVRVYNWTEDSIIPEEITIYLRLTASTSGAETIYSNVVSMKVHPYYIDPTEAVYDVWYLIGDCIGDGSWKNEGMENVGVSILPMYPAYNEFTADGKFLPGCMYVGYFPAGKGFKLIMEPGSWDNQWGVDDEGKFVKNSDKSSNITVDEDGYYMIWYNSATDKLTMEKYEGSVSVYDMVSMPGGYQDPEWDPTNNVMNAFSTAYENHDWFLRDLEFDSDTELKFAANGGWDVNWGRAEFPYSMGLQGGDNIPVLAGKYHVFINDIMGAYTFIAVE